MSDSVLEATDRNWETEIMGATLPVVVDFWGAYCPPCKRYAPTFEAVAGMYGGQVLFAKMNIEDNPEVPGRLGIRAVPTTLFVAEGQIKGTALGALDQAALTAAIQTHLGVPRPAAS